MYIQCLVTIMFDIFENLKLQCCACPDPHWLLCQTCSELFVSVVINYPVYTQCFVKNNPFSFFHTMQGCGLGRDISVSRRTNVSVASQTKSSTSRSRLGLGPMRLRFHLGLGAICLGLGPVGLVLGLGHCVSSRRFVQAGALHTVAAVRVILTSMTFVA